MNDNTHSASGINSSNVQTAIFAAGCFWGVQAYFDQVPGVKSSEVGYIGGSIPNPTYEQVCTHITGHAEAVRLQFDPSIISYNSLLKHFFRLHDPTQLNRQGPDVGDNYRSVIFYTSDEQRQSAEAMIAALEQAGTYPKPIVTAITAAPAFYLAEPYHQKYFQRTGRGACHVDYAPVG